MKRTKTTEIIIETDEIFVLHPHNAAAPVASDCPACGAKMTTPEEAASLRKLPPRHVYRLVEAGGAHFTEAADGRVLVCLASLSSTAAKVETNDRAALVLNPAPPKP